MPGGPPKSPHTGDRTGGLLSYALTRERARACRTASDQGADTTSYRLSSSQKVPQCRGRGMRVYAQEFPLQ